MSLSVHDEAVQSTVDLDLVLKLLALGSLIELQLFYLLLAISDLLLELGHLGLQLLPRSSGRRVLLDGVCCGA